MGYVTITSTEHAGESLSRSESIHFECVEDFLKYKGLQGLQSTDGVVGADITPESKSWIAWNGHHRDGPASIPRDTKVEVRLRDGVEHTGAGSELVSYWDWRHDNDPSSDIIAYRIYKGE